MIHLRRVLTWALFQIGNGAGSMSSLFHYLTISTLRLADMRESIRSAWQDFSPDDVDIAAGLTPREKDLVGRFLPSGARVLVVGCGSGRELIALAERGYHVTGVDPADSALRTARRIAWERELSATLVEGFFEEVPLSGLFDGIMFSPYCYGYIPESHRRVVALRKAAEHLTPGGHILISYPAQGRPRSVTIRLARLMGALSRSDWRLEAGDLVSVVSRNQPRYSYCHEFQVGEIEQEAAAAGLTPVFGSESRTDRVVVLVRA
jgi:SAM-dependent methyltransferase